MQQQQRRVKTGAAAPAAGTRSSITSLVNTGVSAPRWACAAEEQAKTVGSIYSV